MQLYKWNQSPSLNVVVVLILNLVSIRQEKKSITTPIVRLIV